MKLKPCPLCGSAAEAYYDSDYYADHEFSIRCSSRECRLVLPAKGVIGSRSETLIVARDVEHWNNRVKPPRDGGDE